MVKRSLVHLDLSLSELQPSVFKNLVTGLKYARTLSSLNVSAANSAIYEERKRIAKEELGVFLFERFDDQGQFAKDDPDS